MQTLPPFMVLPVAGPGQAEAMSFFEYTSIKHLTEYHHCKAWQRTLNIFSQTVPSVRYAAMALAMIHRNYLDRDSGGRMRLPQFVSDWQANKTPMLYYNRAIQLLINQESDNITVNTAVTLLVCYLFTCFEHLAGNDLQAVKHLRAGVELSRSIDYSIINSDSAYGGNGSSETRTLICQVARQIRRLDMQAVMFLVDWTPTDAQETFIQNSYLSPLAPSGSIIQYLDHAADHLQVIIARVMRLRNTGQQLSTLGEMPPLPWSYKDIVLKQLETWSSYFENTLQQVSFYKTNSDIYRHVLLLRLQFTIAWTFLSSLGHGGEMDYDGFLPQFQQCVALASEVTAAHVQYSGSLKPTFTPEIGVIPVLYIVGVKCRHPVVRRETLKILRRQPIREAVWDSISAARVIERVIEIEEGGAEEERISQSMDQIPVWRRIEAMSWTHIVKGQSAVRLDITYTFCMQEGIHRESLMI